MNELPSTEFRKTYHTLKEPTIVTVNGHPIGTYQPIDQVIILDQAPFDKTIELMQQDDAEHGTLWPKPNPQAQRDELLRKISRSK